MQLGKTWRRLIFAGALGLMVVLGGAACGGDDPTNSGDMMDLSGTIEIDGSSTVAPISEAVAEDFGLEYSDVRVNVGVSGTGGGFKRFTAGETEISDASRPIKDSEAEVAAENGIEYIELTVALDGLAIMAHPSNELRRLPDCG